MSATDRARRARLYDQISSSQKSVNSARARKRSAIAASPHAWTQKRSARARGRLAPSLPSVKSHHRQEAKRAEGLPVKSSGPRSLDPRDDVATIAVGAGLGRRETEQKDHRLRFETSRELCLEVPVSRVGVPAIRQEGDIPGRRRLSGTAQRRQRRRLVNDARLTQIVLRVAGSVEHRRSPEPSDLRAQRLDGFSPLL